MKLQTIDITDTNIPLHSIQVKLKDGVLNANALDEVLMLDTTNNSYFGLDSVGSRMLTLMESLPITNI